MYVQSFKDWEILMWTTEWFIFVKKKKCLLYVNVEVLQQYGTFTQVARLSDSLPEPMLSRNSLFWQHTTFNL